MGGFSRAAPERNYPCHLLNHETSDHLLSLVENNVPCVGHRWNMSHSRLTIKDLWKIYFVVMIQGLWFCVGAPAPKPSRHCERSEAIQLALFDLIASLRSQ
jgi:hypothetical protein